jgi:NADH-quinone oxidoreductase subunit E
MDVCRERINHDPFELNPEGTMSWEEVECLGACVNAPMVMIGNDTYEDLTVERFETLVETFGRGRGAEFRTGTQVERMTSAAEGGATTLLEKPTAERTYKPLPPPPAPPAAGLAPAAAVPAPKPADPPAAKADEPTQKGRKREVGEEGAPALEEPKGAPKVSHEKAESELARTDASARADGQPNKAMREDATGAESPAGKLDAGKAPGKPRKGDA